MSATGHKAAGLFGFGPNTRRDKAKQGLIDVQTQYLKDNPNASTEGVLPEAILAAQPIEVPKPPPSAFDAANQGAQAMSDAARRYRRQRGAGLAVNTSNGAAGDPGDGPDLPQATPREMTQTHPDTRHVYHEHVTSGLDCWCGPAFNRVCDECDGKSECWKCVAGLIVITKAEAELADEPLVIVHIDASRF